MTDEQAASLVYILISDLTCIREYVISIYASCLIRIVSWLSGESFQYNFMYTNKLQRRLEENRKC